MNLKFNKELKELVKDQVIPIEMANRITQYYEQKEAAKPNTLFTIFGVFGALLVGSGIILMLAHNWDNFAKITKTLLSFIPLLIGQFFTGFSILKNKSKTWKEASGTFLFFAVGASISLISQIYNIPGDLSTFLQTWIILCLPLIYLLRSHAVALLIIIFSTYYAVEVGLWNYRNRETPWLYIAFILAALPHYWLQVRKYITANATTIFNWMIPASIAIALGGFIQNNGELGFVLYVTLFGLYYSIGRLPVFAEMRTLKNGWLIMGSLGTIILLMMFSFTWFWDEIFEKLIYDFQEFYGIIFLGVLSILIIGYMVFTRGIRSVNLFQYAFLIFWALFFLRSGVSLHPAILINIVVFALGITAIKIGADRFNFGILNYGMLIISVLIICRFFDTKISFVLRGLLFVTVGAGFFLTNYIMLKKSKKRSRTLKV